eukprot:10482028-Alexandrium_andersonii.AAC.1
MLPRAVFAKDKLPAWPPGPWCACSATQRVLGRLAALAPWPRSFDGPFRRRPGKLSRLSESGWPRRRCRCR